MTQEAIDAMQETWEQREREWVASQPKRESRKVEERLAVYEPANSGAWISSTDTVEVRE